MQLDPGHLIGLIRTQISRYAKPEIVSYFPGIFRFGIQPDFVKTKIIVCSYPIEAGEVVKLTSKSIGYASVVAKIVLHRILAVAVHQVDIGQHLVGTVEKKPIAGNMISGMKMIPSDTEVKAERRCLFKSSRSGIIIHSGSNKYVAAIGSENFIPLHKFIKARIAVLPPPVHPGHNNHDDGNKYSDLMGFSADHSGAQYLIEQN